MISFRCGRCAGPVEAADSEAGRAVKCQRCGHANFCPEPSVTPSSASAPRLRDHKDSRFSLSWIASAALAAGAVVWAVWSIVGAAETSAATPAALSPTEALQREILAQNLFKTGDPLLSDLYLMINKKHFNGVLPRIPIRWEPRLEEVGLVADGRFTLEGMYGHVGAKAAILLHPKLQTEPDALRRALCHEIVHAYLDQSGDPSSGHGSAFQAVLKRLALEGAFAGVVATDEERRALKSWLDAEGARIQAEPDAAARDLAIAHYNREVERYNLMLAYPDGVDEEQLIKKVR
jgi:hypothetical protein